MIAAKISCKNWKSAEEAILSVVVKRDAATKKREGWRARTPGAAPMRTRRAVCVFCVCRWHVELSLPVIPPLAVPPPRQ